ncbi:hypothetical protein LIMHP_14400 [Leptospira interrogans serovar Manilae]|nr:hypothetical protein LIMLP_14405 [Leptospira interrogans serovar Manilae]AKP30779.1 hypothetical protein LIMHP_14400 [Leptospira interrogans serovar Manilae]EYU62617.1 hypothetical protein CI00_19235 [Leptospira interrogans serovar Manilae]
MRYSLLKLISSNFFKCLRIQDFKKIESLKNLESLKFYWNQKAEKFWDTRLLKNSHFVTFDVLTIYRRSVSISV